MQIQRNQKFKTDYCFYCYFPITAPINETLVKCPNSNCRKLNIFLCHIINPDDNKNDLVCLKCSANLVMINCGSCGGFQAWNKSNGNFRNGMKHQCECGSISTFIYCNNCQFLLSIKGKKSHQLAMIQCKNCTSEFRYKICESCHILIYKQHWDTSELFVCPNNNCPKSNVVNPYEMTIPNNQFYINRLTQFDLQNSQTISTNVKAKDSDRESCKICFNSEADMINTKCYHLAVCQKCSIKLSKQCPICRSHGGQFKKVFKA